MMFAVVYLSAKPGVGARPVSNHQGFLPTVDSVPDLGRVLIGNTIEAGANLGGMAAALNQFVPVSIPCLAAAIAGVILALQVFGSYPLIRNVFRWLALVLLAYVGAALTTKPNFGEILRGTLIPTIRLDHQFLTMAVAVIGTTLSAYLYSWQSNGEVEEKIATGQTRLAERKGACEADLRSSRRDTLIGMTFSNLVMYFVILATAALHKSGHTQIDSEIASLRSQ
jgi:Mn2+/Fe2+ NRAMP family transporter